MFNKLLFPLIWLMASGWLSIISYAQQTPDALQKATMLYEKLRQGADFESLAIAYSDDPGSARQGGNLGFARKGHMVKPFEKVALSLKPGEISKPFRTEFGYHIVQLIERRGKEYNCRHILVR